MRSKKSLLMSAAGIAMTAIAVCLPLNPAHAQQAEVGSIAYLPPPSLTQIEPAAGGGGMADNDRRQWARYFEYEHRENCQNYVDPPVGWVKVRCKLQRVSPPVAAVLPNLVSVEPAAGGEMTVAAALQSQAIYFDFDRDEIRPGEQAGINAAVQNIQQMRPSLVTVAGHADAAGPNDYNDALSQRRAQAVTNALTAQGVAPDIIEQRAYGESQLAVPTADGVPLQANRRVSIGFQPGAAAGTPVEPGM